MNELPGLLESLYGQHAQKPLFLEALSRARENTGREWAAARKILAGSRWVFGSDDYLDDTGDTHFACRFPKSGEGKTRLLDVLAGILMKQADDPGFAVPIRRVEQDANEYKLVLSHIATVNLSGYVKSMRLEGVAIEAGRSRDFYWF